MGKVMDKINRDICDIMIRHCSDGHIDGYEYISNYVFANMLRSESKENKRILKIIKDEIDYYKSTDPENCQDEVDILEGIYVKIVE